MSEFFNALSVEFLCLSFVVRNDVALVITEISTCFRVCSKSDRNDTAGCDGTIVQDSGDLFAVDRIGHSLSDIDIGEVSSTCTVVVVVTLVDRKVVHVTGKSVDKARSGRVGIDLFAGEGNSIEVALFVFHQSRLSIRDLTEDDFLGISLRIVFSIPISRILFEFEGITGSPARHDIRSVVDHVVDG